MKPGYATDFATVCQSGKKPVHTLEEEESYSEEESYAVSEETAHAISTVKKSKSDLVLVTCTINRQHQVTFEIDTGASCNVLPDYVKATGDKDGHNLKKTTTHLMMHNNFSEYPMGRVMLCVQRNGITHYLRFYTSSTLLIPKGILNHRYLPNGVLNIVR